MDKFTRFLCILTLCFFVVGINNVDAQRKKKSDDVDEYFDEKGGFAHRLWYGGGFNLGFSGSNGFSAFNFGVSPMVGYKIFEPFSVGPRVRIDYTYIKGPTIEQSTGFDRGIQKVETVTYSLGLFTRYKIFSQFFVHVEGEFESGEFVVSNGSFLLYDKDEQKVVTVRENRNNFNIGAGYNSGGIFAYEVYLLYNVLEPENSLNLPFDIRFGFTYKF